MVAFKKNYKLLYHPPINLSMYFSIKYEYLNTFLRDTFFLFSLKLLIILIVQF